LTKEIAGLDEDISIWNGDIKAATNVREIEKADYDAMHKDYSESVDALQRAIAVLKKQSHDRGQKSALMQVSSLALIPENAKQTIDAFLQQSGEDVEGLAVTAPEANGYEFQSSGVVEMLEKLLDKFIDERTTLEKEEMNSKHAYDMLMQDLKAQIANAEADRDAKAESKAKNLQNKADANGDLNDTTATMNADKKYLADLTATCETKASDFESRQQLRPMKLLQSRRLLRLSHQVPSRATLTSTFPPCCRSRPPSRSSCPPPARRSRAVLHSTCKHRLRN
jgi:DNA repair exonuclease SbcCD ATPase subunit